MKLLDLFCGAGGCSVGYFNSGFNVYGVDVNYMGNYPFIFIQDDAINFIKHWGKEFDIIHASPPCQGYGKNATRTNGTHPKLIEEIRNLIKETGKPYVIENTEGSPLIKPVRLCGQMFGLNVIRHRIFESNIPLRSLVHPYHPKTGYFTVAGHKHGTYEQWCNAMQIFWMDRKELAQAIPPAYTEYIGRQLIKALR